MKLHTYTMLALLSVGAQVHGQSSADWGIGPFTRPATGNPVLTPRPETTFNDPILKRPVGWETLHTFNPAAVVRGGKVYVLYRAEDDSGTGQIGTHTSRLGLAESSDGIHFTRLEQPVFYPAEDDQKAREWPGGVEDPRVVEGEDGTYVLTYTQWNRQTYSVGIATSTDLRHWTKHGPAFLTAEGGKYAHLQYKSAGIVTRVDSIRGRLLAAKIKGRYWMYWGEGVIRLATSVDLIHWTPVEGASGMPLELLTPRSGHFDSTFPETGPPPVLTNRGIVVVYNGKNAATDNGKNAATDNGKNAATDNGKNAASDNGKNAASDNGKNAASDNGKNAASDNGKNAASDNGKNAGDPGLGAGAYAAGEALFDARDPTRLLAQTERPVLKPEMAYEKTGQYAAGTTFAEGLVYFRGKWFLYFGCADSFVAVATAPALSGSDKPGHKRDRAGPSHR